jgi:hypothetical protein
MSKEGGKEKINAAHTHTHSLSLFHHANSLFLILPDLSIILNQISLDLITIFFKMVGRR